MVKNLPTIQETQIRSLGGEDPLEKGTSTHSSVLAWKIPWTEESGGLQSMVSQRVGYNWATNTFSFFSICKLGELIKVWGDKQDKWTLPNLRKVRKILKLKSGTKAILEHCLWNQPVPKFVQTLWDCTQRPHLQSIWLSYNIVPLPLSRCFSPIKTNFRALKVEIKENSFLSNHVGMSTENTASQI